LIEIIETGEEIIFANATASIPDNASAIGVGAFSGGYAAPIKIPLSVTDIKPLAFVECEGLTVYVPYKSEDDIPSGWADDWHDGSVTVVWGYTEEDTNTYLVTESGEFLTDEQGNLLII
jgi:hypothetical protein